MSKIYRLAALIGLVLAFAAACLEEVPPADWADANQPMLMDMGECGDESDGECYGDMDDVEGEVW